MANDVCMVWNDHAAWRRAHAYNPSGKILICGQELRLAPQHKKRNKGAPEVLTLIGRN
jgi:hypothetical protein